MPPGWWHYVESLDFSISVNMWLPILTDNISRVKEAIVKLIIAKIGKDIYNIPEIDEIDSINLVMYNKYLLVVKLY